MNETARRFRRYRRSVLAPLLGGLVALVGCDSVTGPLDDLAEARQRWTDANVTTYTYTLRRSCFCTPESIGPVQISVSNGLAVERTFVSNGQPAPADDRLWPTIDGLFDRAEEALRDADSVTVRYNPSLGYPLELAVDWIRQAVDDEESLVVESFALPSAGSSN